MKILAPLRGTDIHGSGAFGAPRGSRTHRGLDYACWPGSIILSPVSGEVTRIGYPYSPADWEKGHLRYVKVRTHDGTIVRVMYISPMVNVGQHVTKGDIIGVAQDLTKVYNGITPHIHVDVKKGNTYINPESYLED